MCEGTGLTRPGQEQVGTQDRTAEEGTGDVCSRTWWLGEAISWSQRQRGEDQGQEMLRTMGMLLSQPWEEWEQDRGLLEPS